MCLWALARLEFLFLHVWTNVFGKKVRIFSLFPTTLLATRKGKDTNLCHLERLELLFMHYRPMFGKTLTFFSLSNFSVGNLEREGHKFMSPLKVWIVHVLPDIGQYSMASIFNLSRWHRIVTFPFRVATRIVGRVKKVNVLPDIGQYSMAGIFNLSRWHRIVSFPFQVATRIVGKSEKKVNVLPGKGQYSKKCTFLHWKWSMQHEKQF